MTEFDLKSIVWLVSLNNLNWTEYLGKAFVFFYHFSDTVVGWNRRNVCQARIELTKVACSKFAFVRVWSAESKYICQ